MLNEIGNGIYFGFAGVDIDSQGRRVSPVIRGGKPEPDHGQVWPMVMSIGLNPFYKNDVRSVVRCIFLSFSSTSQNYLRADTETNRKFI